MRANVRFRFTALLLVLGVVLGILNVSGAFLARHFPFLAEPRPPEQVITASIATEPAPYTGTIVGIPQTTAATTQTLLDFQYRTPIDVNETADIAVVLRQELRVVKRTVYPAPKSPALQGAVSDSEQSPGTYAIPQLQWPITLALNGPGFEWVVNEIKIKKNTPLPDTEHWIPRAKKAGEYVLRFPLRDINHAAETPGASSEHDIVKVKINGLDREARGSDDLTLSISVWTLGIPAWWYDQLTLWGAVAAFCLGTGFVTKIVTKWLESRKHQP